LSSVGLLESESPISAYPSSVDEQNSSIRLSTTPTLSPPPTSQTGKILFIFISS
jgi:hypothetical protein